MQPDEPTGSPLRILAQAGDIERLSEKDFLNISRHGRPRPRNALMFVTGYNYSFEDAMLAGAYPGFGHSDTPDAKDFSYTFDHLTEVMDHFTQALGLKRHALYLQDCGGPIGFGLRSHIPNALRLLSSKMPYRTRMASDPFGKPEESIGQTEPPTKLRFDKTFCRSQRPASGMSVRTRMSKTSTQIFGRMSSLS